MSDAHEELKSVPVAARVNRFSYAIRNIVAEAKAVEARGQRVRYLNIGDPVAFGFQTPAHLVEAVARAMRDGHNGYLPSAGIRRGARGGCRRLHRPRRRDFAGSRPHHHRHVGRHRAGAERARGRGRRGARAVADLSAVHRGAGEDRRANPGTTAPILSATGCPDLDHLRSARHAPHPRARRHRSEQPDGRGLSRTSSARIDRLCGAPRSDDSGRRGLRRSRVSTGRCR